MTSIQPELWVENPDEAVKFYKAAFGAKVLHRVGEGDDIVAQLSVGDAPFWVAPSSAQMKRLSPRERNQRWVASGLGSSSSLRRLTGTSYNTWFN